ncbi:hypothetical protein J7K74_02010 [Candidatus Woesearchaeota archaeon]|nr:hypothetical protein [Candidatus Woesearchaeota archaeon]
MDMDELLEELGTIEKRLRLISRYGVEINRKERLLSMDLERLRSRMINDKKLLRKEIMELRKTIKDLDMDIFLLGNKLSLMVEKQRMEEQKRVVEGIDPSKLEPL